MDFETVEKWAEGLEELGARIGKRFVRAEPRQRANGHVQGLTSVIPRKNGWQMAEHLGESTPDGMQRLLNAVKWDEDGVQAYVIEYLGETNGILAIDKTGFLKKGVIQSVSNANIVSQRGGWNTVR